MKNQTKHFAELDFEERNKLLALPPSQWKEDSPIYFKDYAQTADKTALAESIVKLVILGQDENTDERAKRDTTITQNAFFIYTPETNYYQKKDTLISNQRQRNKNKEKWRTLFSLLLYKSRID